MLSKISNFIIIVGFALTSCKKEPVPPAVIPQPQPVVEMEYTNLNNRDVKYQQSGVTLDVNKDNKANLFFGVQLIADPINAVDKRQYIVLSGISTAVAVNIN